MRGSEQLVFRTADYQASRTVPLPLGLRVSQPTWSPDGSQVAFLGHREMATTLWVVDAKTLTAREVSPIRLQPVFAANIEWLLDNQTIVAAFEPNPIPVMPSRESNPMQPRVLVSDPAKIKNRPLRGLLETQLDQALYKYFATVQIAKVNVHTGAMAPIGTPDMIRSFNVAPDGSALRVTRILEPFSYVVPASSFGTKEDLITGEGKLIEELQKRPLRMGDQPPTNPTPPTTAPGGGAGRPGGQRPGGSEGPGNNRRGLAWSPDGNGMIFLQLEPAPPRKEGEPTVTQAKRKDRLMRWVAPYGKDNTKVLYEQDALMSSVSFSDGMKVLFISQANGTKDEIHAVAMGSKDKPVLISSKVRDDFYDTPGSLVSESTATGSAVVLTDDGHVYLSGTQLDKDPLTNAPRAFLKKVNITTGKAETIWQSPTDEHHAFVRFMDASRTKVMLNVQSPTQLPNFFSYDLQSKAMQQVTRNVDYAPQMAKAQRFRVQIKRADGFKFWADVTAPHYFVKGMKLPTMFWFYPSEFVDQKAYDDSKRTYNKNLFPTTSSRSMELLTLLGYVVVEPDCPIVGPANRKNDAYIPDLRNNLSATIDELDKQGYIDRSRLGIGGHSYGAFSAANAMIHTPFFKAGIAGDGNYLRMLTPMAFQAEDRAMWEARETYINMSPLLFAEQMTGAFLMYHGADDNNPGTNLINSERMFNALDGLGKDVALYVYPFEDHNPVAMDTILDMWARWIPWLERYLKGVVPPEPKPEEKKPEPPSR